MSALQRATGLLQPLLDESRRGRLLGLAFFESQRAIYDSIRQDGATDAFTADCVRQLLARGPVGSRHALSLPLEVAAGECVGDARRQADFVALIGELDAQCSRPPADEADAPYRGLQAFGEADERFFFGRDDTRASCSPGSRTVRWWPCSAVRAAASLRSSRPVWSRLCAAAAAGQWRPCAPARSRGAALPAVCSRGSTGRRLPVTGRDDCWRSARWPANSLRSNRRRLASACRTSSRKRSGRGPAAGACCSSSISGRNCTPIVIHHRRPPRRLPTACSPQSGACR